MSHDPSRKHFFAKLIGFFAAVGLASNLLAKRQQRSEPQAAPIVPISLRPEVRAVARRESTV